MNSSDLSQRLFEGLMSDLENKSSFADSRPLLAHFTTIAVVEQILKNKEIWFSNPLFMNDHEEIRFGMLQGVEALIFSAELRDACKSVDDFDYLCDQVIGYRDNYAEAGAVDTFVFSLSIVEEDDHDGLLSMWRGYGGNGGGAALVFDTKALTENQDSPLIVAPVEYLSTVDRLTALKELVSKCGQLIKKYSVAKDGLHLVAHHFLERLKIFSLFTKHVGFKEEKEWRVVYMPERDPDGVLKPLFGYHIGPSAIEPKLKFPIGRGSQMIGGELEMNKLVHRIILGPTMSSPLARASFLKMLAVCAPALSEKVVTSSIPYRSRI